LAQTRLLSRVPAGTSSFQHVTAHFLVLVILQTELIRRLSGTSARIIKSAKFIEFFIMLALNEKAYLI